MAEVGIHGNRTPYAETGTARFAASPLNQLKSFLSALLLGDSTDT